MPRPAERDGPRLGLSPTALLAAAVAILVLRALLQLPHDYSFRMFGFGDPGASLTVYEQLAAGRIPYRDFGYPYGLLPLPLGQLWFATFGRTPAAYLALAFACDVLVVLAFVRLVRALGVGLVGQLWLLATVAAFVPSGYLTPGHAIEAVLLAHAVADLAAGRWRRAVVLATACAFVKPSMAYVIGLLLVLIGARDAWRRAPGGSRPTLGAGAVTLARGLLPAAATAVAIAAALAVRFGPGVVVESLLPATGMRIYARMGYTPPRLLGEVLLPDASSLAGYWLGTPVATVVLGTALLSAAALAALRPGAPEPDAAGRRRADCVVVCGASNLVYWALMIGPVPSYLYLVGLGLAAVGAGSSIARRAVAALVPVALLGLYSPVRDVQADWASNRRDARLGNLWGREDVAREWGRVRELTREGSAALLVRSSGYDRLFDGFVRPPCYYFDRGLTTEADVRRQLEILARARYVVTAAEDQQRPLLDLFPELATALQPMQVVWRGTHFTVHRSPGAGRGTAPGPALGAASPR